MLLGVPDAPPAPTVPEMFRESCVVTWQPPSNDGGAPIIGYTVERLSSFSPRWVRVNKELVPDTRLQVTDLIEDNSYQFRVTAENKAGPSQPSEPSESTLAKDPWSKCMIDYIAYLITYYISIRLCAFGIQHQHVFFA